MGEDIKKFSECDMYVDGEYIGSGEILVINENKEFDVPNEGFNLNKSFKGTFSISKEDGKNLIKVFQQALDPVRQAVIKFLELIRKFLNDNPELIKIAKDKIKYEKRIRNRQRLYEKKRALGRKL
jgi:hypothetical protein